MPFERDGMQLHDRKTKGDVLTPEENAQLENWYASQDAQEASEISPALSSLDTASVQTQTRSILSQLTMTTQRIEFISIENEAIRQEISELKSQLIAEKSA